MLILVFLLFSSLDLHLQISGATTTDTLALGQSLPWNQTLVSKGGTFELGLFSPGKSRKHYIGIWFKKVSKQAVVWVANRDRPILDPSASRFTLSDRGELLLLLQYATPSNTTLLWSSNASTSPSPPPRTTVATLQDDGNLVVRSNDDVAWQSFDHPTDTWLPGARLGYDRARGVHSYLTSWTDAENPAPGAFSLEIDPRGQAELDLLAGGTHTYWASGVWDGESFDNIPEMRSGHFQGVPYDAPTNASVNFFSYKNRVPGSIGIFVLETNGQLQRRWWSPEEGEWKLYCSEPHDECDVYGSCGAFGVCSNTSSAMCECPTGFAPRSPAEWELGNAGSGCVRRTKLDCPNDGFVELPYDVQLPGGSAEAAAGARSDRTCALSCLRDCSCTAYAYDGDAAKCLVWNGELVNLRTLDQGIAGAVVLHVRVAASDVPPSAAHRSWAWRKSIMVIILSSCSLSAVVLLLAAAAAVCRKRRRGKGKVAALHGSLLVLDYQAVKAATRDFTEKLGSGSFGSVYKGTLPDATPVAVKRFDGGLRQGDKQFRAEVVTLGMIHHTNLVRLRGFCSEGNKKALVYDYMPNGSLDAYLFNTSSTKVLSWSQRFGIAVGVARGLSYLHEKCRECIIHCDIKPDNVLLDEELGAKLADFGMAKLVGRDFSRVLTTTRGTMGYLAPEWLAGAPVTAKADVYSFGLLLFELVSGRRNNGSSSEAEVEEGPISDVYFPVHAAVRLHAGDVVGLLDERIAGDANVKELERVCKVACWCIQDEEGDRPTMGLVVQQLEGVADVGLPPVPSRLHRLAMVNEWVVGGEAEVQLYSNDGSKLGTEEVHRRYLDVSGDEYKCEGIMLEEVR